MTNRTLTKHQFSDQTTIDGNRIEDALQDVQERFNSLDFKDIDGWYENRFHFANTPALISAGSLGYLTNTFVWHNPWTLAIRSEMPHDLDETNPNNPFRFKGASRFSPNTNSQQGSGLPSGAEYDMGWFWTTTKYFSKPTIINDFTVFGLFDSDFTEDGGTEAWFNNLFSYSVTQEWADDLQMWIIVDNPLNTGDTFVRNSEVHLWGSSAGSFIMSGDLQNPPLASNTGENILTWYPDASIRRVNGGAWRMSDLNIPVFAGSRVRFVVGVPAFSEDTDSETPVPNQSGVGDGQIWNETTNWSGDSPATFGGNIWTVNISVFHPLEKTHE